MSMMGRLVEISPALLQRIRTDPAVLDEVRAKDLGPPIPAEKAAALQTMLTARTTEALAERIPAEHRSAFLDQVRAMRVTASGTGTRTEPEGVRSRLNIEKAWHGVHFLICGTAGEADPPLGNAVLGGTEVGPDHGYGPVRYLTPDEVSAIGSAVTALDDTALQRRWNVAAMAEARIYPGVWDDKEALPWLLDACKRMRTFYSRAARNGSAVLAYLT